MTEQDNLGNPQKTAPCGGDATLTGEISQFNAGDTITISIDETIYHPGHYRVALAINDPSELPDAPPVTPGPGDECAETVIQDPAVYPVLADGMIPHDAPFAGPQSFEVTLPDDVECENCTLQVIQYMRQHGAPCFYYHCAEIAIAADPSQADTGDDDDDDATTGGAADSSGDGTDPTADDDDDDAPGDDDDDDDAPGGDDDDDDDDDDPTAAGSEGSGGDGGANDDSDSGCACGVEQPTRGAPVALLLTALGLIARRRR